MTPRMSLPRPVLASLTAIAVLLGSAAAETSVEGLVIPLREVVVASPARKPLVEIAVAEGDPVKAGQRLARLDARTEEIDVERLKKVLMSREFDKKAGVGLRKEKIISEEDALDRELEYEIAKLQLAAAEALLERTEIRAPMSGTVVDRYKEVGETPTDAEPLLRIIDTSKVFARIHLRREQAFDLKTGETVQVDILFPRGKTLRTEGVVDFVSPEINADSGLRRAKVLIDNAEGQITAGLRARVLLPAAP